MYGTKAVKPSLEMIRQLERELLLVEYRFRPYAFDADRCNKNAKLLGVIRQVTEKIWVTDLHIQQFLQLAINICRRLKSHNPTPTPLLKGLTCEILFLKVKDRTLWTNGSVPHASMIRALCICPAQS